MQFISAYLIRQVADKSGGSGPDPEGLGDMWKRAKSAGNPLLITDEYFITEPPQTFMDHFIDNGIVIRHEIFKKQSDAGYTHGVIIDYPDQPWKAYRYPVEAVMYHGFPLTTGTVWYSPTVIARLKVSATMEGAPDDWIECTDAYAGVEGEACFKHVAEDGDWDFPGPPHNTFMVYHENIVTNIPHFATQADGAEFESKAYGYWIGTVTEADFRAFLRSKMVSP